MMSEDHLSTQLPLINFIRANSSLSRRDVLAAIDNREVTVNKQIITDATFVVTNSDSVYVNKTLIKQTELYYYKFYKPIGTLSTFDDPKGRRDLSWHLKKRALPKSLKPCGRLDSDSSGLLLFSNDGQFINQVLHPKYTIPKRYLITLNKPLLEQDKQQLSTGFFLPDGPVSIEFTTQISLNEYEVTISIGRNRILRRSFEHFGYTITILHRLAIGPITIAQLKPGEFQKINPDLIKILVQP